MLTTTFLIFGGLTAAAVACQVGYTLLLFTIGMRRRILLGAPSDPKILSRRSDWPGVTILKPCAGADDDLDKCVESYCRLNYPNVQVIFGVRDEKDPAYPVLCAAKAKHPDVDIEVVTCQAGRSPSPKVANLEVMITLAKHDLFWLSDSNTIVHPDTLAGMVDELLQPGVGLVVSPVVGVGEQTAGAALDLLQLDAFVGFAAIATATYPKQVTAPGKSSLVRREHLEKIGLEELGRYFGEDLVLFDGIRDQGLTQRLGQHVVGNVCKTYTLKKFMSRHLRWTQIRWTAAPLPAVLFEFLFVPTVPAAFFAVFVPGQLSLGVFAGLLVYQLVVDLYVLRRLRGHWLALRFWPLAMLRPFVHLFLWARASVDRRVEWRGKKYWMGPRSSVLSEPPFRAWLRAVRSGKGA